MALFTFPSPLNLLRLSVDLDTRGAHVMVLGRYEPACGCSVPVTIRELVKGTRDDARILALVEDVLRSECANYREIALSSACVLTTELVESFVSQTHTCPVGVGKE